MKHIIAALLALASFEVLAQPADEFHQVRLGAQAVMACAHVDDCLLSSKHSSLTARIAFNYLTRGIGRDAFQVIMGRVLDGAGKGDPEACKAAMAVNDAMTFVSGTHRESTPYLEECAK